MVLKRVRRSSRSCLLRAAEASAGDLPPEGSMPLDSGSAVIPEAPCRVIRNAESASSVDARIFLPERVRPPACAGGPVEALVLLFTSLLAAALARQGFLQPGPLARLQVVGVTLNFLNNVLLLHLPLEAAQRVLKGLTLLKTNFRQACNTPKLAQSAEYSLPYFPQISAKFNVIPPGRGGRPTPRAGDFQVPATSVIFRGCSPAAGEFCLPRRR